jgi:5-methylcytosine-specific restriction endonuclease McrA
MKTKRKSLIDKLDKEFSIFIRNRYAKNGMAECVTCGAVKEVKQLQCGHFMSRKHYSTRWAEDNCQVQCYTCNVMRYGEQYKFGLYLNATYNKDKAEELLIQSKQTLKLSDFELEDMIEKYKIINKTFAG